MSRKAKTKLLPIPLKNVSIKGGFWEPRVRINREVTLPIEYEQCQKTGRLDAWKLSWKPGDPNPPHIFWDSDVAKWIEAAAYSLTTHPDAELEKKVDDIIDRIAKAQQKDGYVNIHFTVVEPRKRWKNLRDWHELYCAGHLIEAAVAYHAATGKQKLLNVMCHYANYIRSVFGRGKRKKRGYPGHEEIELALVKLYRATGTRRYLNLAKFFIDERGTQPHYFDIEAKARGENLSDYWAGSYDYCQAHVPVRQQITYVDSEAQFTIGETRVSLRQNTEYPWKEQVVLNVEVDKTTPFTLALRIPGWCRKAHMRMNDKVIDTEKHLEKGYLKLQRTWKPGDTVELRLRMPAKRIEAHPSVRHNCGRIALQRGPIVYCLEEIDNGKELNDIVVPRSSRLSVKTYRNLLGGIPVITAKAQWRDTSGWDHTLYRPAGSSQIHDTIITAIPYFMWANRDPGEMLVWIRET